MRAVTVLVLLRCILNVFTQNAPPVAEFYGSRELPEDTPPGTVVYSVIASDPDSPDSSLSLHLDSNTFQLWSYGNRGNVTLLKTLNFEASTTTEFVLIVTGGDQSETRYKKVITVTDVNDVQPKFRKLRYKTHLDEDIAVGSLVFEDVYVYDEDVSNSGIEVVCSYNPAFPDACHIFGLDTLQTTNTYWRGNIYLRRPLDYETMQETYQLRLNATDGNPANDYLMNFEIIIDDVTDAPPYFTTTFDARINEDVALGTYVLTVNAEDGDKKDQRPIRYAIVDNPGELFTVDPITGDINTSRPLTLNSEVVGAQGIVFLNVTAQEVLADNSLGSDTTTQSFAKVKITILDVNDNPPTFSQTHYSVNMSEGLQNGQAVPGLVMHVSDADGADNAYFKFVFAGLRDYEHIFRVSPPEAQGSATATLVIQDSSALDYDFGLRVYTLEVIAREVRTSSNLSSTAIVTVYLEDANDNVPQFDVGQFYIEDLSELTQPGELISSLPKATDPDTGLFGTAGIVYSLIGYGNNRFEVDRLTGDLRLSQCSVPGTGNCLDYEAVHMYNLSLIATDNNGTAHETAIPLTISILDENDNIPEFTSYTYQYRVQEATTLLRTEQEIYATDRDSSRNGNNRVRYSLITDRSALFTIDSVSGSLSLNRPIEFRDGDENGRLRITVGAGNFLDGASRVDYTKNTTVEILVDDINNNAPVFSRNYSRQIPENTRPDIEIIRVEADDADFGINAVIEYSIVSGADNTFQIDINSGVISRRNGGILDYEVRPSYVIVVKATDRGFPRQSGFATVRIDIIDDNNRYPVFSPLTTYANVSEDAGLDFTVVSMQAIDRDSNAVLHYSFIQPITAYHFNGLPVNIQDYDYTRVFRIDSRTGQVFVNSKLDVTQAQRVIYTVRAEDTAADGSDQIGKGTLIIDIINANIHPPVFENLNKENSVLEEQDVGSLVMVLTAADADRDLVTYDIISQSIPGVLHVQPTTGIVTVAGRIDFETVQTISYTARASDGNNDISNRYTDQQFTVNVININDNTPRFSQPYYESEIAENSTDRQTVTTVSATDLDLPPYGDVRYRLPQSVTRFRVDEVSGVLYKIPGVEFDREEIDLLQIPVIAYDGPGTPSRSAVVPVYISIKDVNDNKPYFNEADIYLTLSNKLPVDSSVTRVFAFDNDPEDTVTYSISNDQPGHYRVSNDGVVRTQLPLTTAPDHTFDVVATDNAGQSAVVHVHVTIIGNKVGPSWVFPSYNGDKIVVCENQEINRVINEPKLISAVGAVRYSFLINGEETDDIENTFRLIPDTGEIITKRSLDREQKDRYLVQVLARDVNGLVNQRYLLIEVCDENDNHPEFPIFDDGSVKDYHFTIVTNLVECVKDPLRNNDCGRVVAHDRDLPINGQIIYSITGGNSSNFVIDPDTGVISTKRGLDHASQSFYSFEVTANNYRMVNGQIIIIPSNSDRRTADVYIEVLPTPSTPPLIKQELNLQTSIDTQIGACLDTMRPEGSTADVSYTVLTETLYNGNIRETEQDNSPRFSVGPKSGLICTIRLFNPSNAGYRYSIDIQVTTSAGETETRTANIWLTENIHKIRIVVDANTEYVNNRRLQIVEALEKILGTEIVWIDSVGYYTTKEGSIDISKSDVIIYAVNMTSKHLYERKETTVFINTRINGEHKSTALYVKILRAEDIITRYIYLPTTSRFTQPPGGGAFPIGLLIAMLLLLPLLLLPFLLCCLLGCPCCASLLGAKKDKYAMLGAAAPIAGAHREESFIDDWYEQSKLYNNPAYDENWDTGSAHMLVNVNKGAGAAGGGITEEITEETEEYYRHYNDGAGNRAAIAGEAAGWDTADAAGANAAGANAAGAHAAGAHAAASSMSKASGHSAKAESAIIVDTLTPAAASGEAHTMVVEEEITEQRRLEEESIERRLEQEQNMNRGRVNPLTTSTETEHHLMSSLSPATLDILDSASAYNAKVGSRKQVGTHHGHFSHTATVPRYGPRHPPESEEYVTSESYESDYHSDHKRHPTSRGRNQEETGMTIILDAQPTSGMAVESAEYEVVSGVAPVSAPSYRSVTDLSNSYRGSQGFTIELEPTTYEDSGMVADREEYLLTDDEGLAPGLVTDSAQSPKQHKRYKKTTTMRTTTDSSGVEH